MISKLRLPTFSSINKTQTLLAAFALTPLWLCICKLIEQCVYLNNRNNPGAGFRGTTAGCLVTHTSVMAAKQGLLLQEPNVHDSKFSKELSKKFSHDPR